MRIESSHQYTLYSYKASCVVYNSKHRTAMPLEPDTSNAHKQTFNDCHYVKADVNVQVIHSSF